ncbi:MAG: L,D-transpeptidase family protein [Candidatus Omnitrophica bacterium]|nr:L,D-transpeptidase family protein [Candidatus Omnitrophota bacterium]
MDRRFLFLIGGIVLIIAIFIGIPKKKNIDDNPPVGVQQQDDPAALEIYEQAQLLRADRKLLETKKLLEQLLNDYSDFQQIERIQEELEAVNMEIIHSNIPTEQSIVHTVKRGDTLGALAKKFGTTVELIKKNNNLPSDMIRIGQKLRIWTGKFNIFVDKSQNILILKNKEDVVKVYSVSTGENNSTPVGDFKITTKLVDPVWFNRGVVVPPESPENVLGSRWLGFNIEGYGIHGTTEPGTIGQQVTAGCVRMRDQEVEELYSIIPLGTRIKIVD